MKHILIPTDFSNNAWNAITYALQLFENTTCTFYILHVNPLPPYSGAGSSVRIASEIVQDTVLKKSREDLRKLILKIGERHRDPKHTFLPVAAYDYFVDTIKRESEQRKIDLIVMGTKGASGLKKATLGSNTGNVMTKVKCPLLSVPEDATFTPPKEIAFPTDYHLSYELTVLDLLRQWALEHDAAIRFLYISKKGEALSQEQEANKAILENYFHDTTHSFHRLTGKKLEDAVQCFTESRDIDMIAMVAKNLNFLQRIIFRPTVEEISYHLEIPFLVLHESTL